VRSRKAAIVSLLTVVLLTFTTPTRGQDADTSTPSIPNANESGEPSDVLSWHGQLTPDSGGNLDLTVNLDGCETMEGQLQIEERPVRALSCEAWDDKVLVFTFFVGDSAHRCDLRKQATSSGFEGVCRVVDPEEMLGIMLLFPGPE
jgi:hypothetical protein